MFFVKIDELFSNSMNFFKNWWTLFKIDELFFKIDGFFPFDELFLFFFKFDELIPKSIFFQMNELFRKKTMNFSKIPWSCFRI